MSVKETKETSIVQTIIISAFLAAVVFAPFWAMDFSWGIFFALWILIIIAFLFYK